MSETYPLSSGLLPWSYGWLVPVLVLTKLLWPLSLYNLDHFYERYIELYYKHVPLKYLGHKHPKSIKCTGSRSYKSPFCYPNRYCQRSFLRIWILISCILYQCTALNIRCAFDTPIYCIRWLFIEFLHRAHVNKIIYNYINIYFSCC